MSTLAKALEVAAAAHTGRFDRYGRPYLLHPLRVMERLKTEEERMTALLHDVVEDSAITLDDLRREGFSAEVVAAVDALSKREGEAYPGYLARVEQNPLARRVKIADLEDNMDLRRFREITPADRERLNRYLDAWHRLLRD